MDGLGLRPFDQVAAAISDCATEAREPAAAAGHAKLPQVAPAEPQECCGLSIV
jgi:hypothetical protein